VSSIAIQQSYPYTHTKKVPSMKPSRVAPYAGDRDGILACHRWASPLSPPSPAYHYKASPLSPPSPASAARQSPCDAGGGGSSSPKRMPDLAGFCGVWRCSMSWRRPRLVAGLRLVTAAYPRAMRRWCSCAAVVLLCGGARFSPGRPARRERCGGIAIHGGWRQCIAVGRRW
jgi:hypothetical protein